MDPWERLRQAREHAGHTSATAAAEALGVTPSTYLGHENGSRGIRPVTAERYARGLGCDASWILYGEPSAQARAIPARPVPSEGVAVSDRRLAEALAVLADTFEDYNAGARRDLIARFWIAFPELRERVESGAGRRMARLARG
ncbi:MAG: helix-turn-helix transcriptional regulator [bacterium]|nr:helix-turn-helix transcriptional regulator [bacterium]